MTDKTIQIEELSQKYLKPFDDLELFHVGSLTYSEAENVVPTGWWVLEKANFGDFYVCDAQHSASLFMDRQKGRFWRLAYWDYQPYYGLDYVGSEALKIRGIWITPSEYDHHPELKEVA